MTTTTTTINDDSNTFAKAKSKISKKTAKNALRPPVACFPGYYFVWLCFEKTGMRSKPRFRAVEKFELFFKTHGKNF